MKNIITYGTFDLFHNGHYNILKRAKDAGEYLVVGVTGEQYDFERGKLNVVQPLSERIENVKKTGLADLIIVESYMGQKISDIQKYEIDTFVIGSDWKGKFDYLNDYCKVVYLERTKNISSTELRNKELENLSIGIAGTGRIAKRFIPESKFVSGCNVSSIYSQNIDNAKSFASNFEVDFYTDDFDEFLSNCDMVYIATPHLLHFEMALKAIKSKKHVLCEKPITLVESELELLFSEADKNEVVLMEAIKTAYCPGFIRLVEMAKSHIIGDIIDMRATFTKLEDKSSREFDIKQAGGSMNELGSYVLLAAERICGVGENFRFETVIENSVDIYTKILGKNNQCHYSLNIGLGVKSEGDLVISGTKGYIYVPAPWWKTQEFELRFEDKNKNKKFFYKFDGDGLRYEISEFLKVVKSENKSSHLLTRKNMKSISRVIGVFNQSYILKNKKQ